MPGAPAARAPAARAPAAPPRARAGRPTSAGSRWPRPASIGPTASRPGRRLPSGPPPALVPGAGPATRYDSPCPTLRCPPHPPRRPRRPRRRRCCCCRRTSRGPGYFCCRYRSYYRSCYRSCYCCCYYYYYCYRLHHHHYYYHHRRRCRQIYGHCGREGTPAAMPPAPGRRRGRGYRQWRRCSGTCCR